VLKITVADIMPAIEAAIAHRIEREIAPQLKAMYSSSAWGLSSANPLYPYPAPFNNPNPGTSDFQGSSAMSAGLLPVTSKSCSGDPRCSATFVAWNQAISPTVTLTGGSGLLAGSTCTFVSATQARCTGLYVAIGSTQLTMTVRASNVAMALRQLDATQATAQYNDLTSWISVTPSASGSFVSDGSANISATATLPGTLSLSLAFQISMDVGVLADHPVIDAADSTYGWFVRNEWHRLLYYAPAAGHTAAALPLPSCTTAATCLSVANLTPAGAQRAILILAGRSINGSARPSATLANYFEFGNASASYERQPVSTVVSAALKKPFNDRVVVIDSN